MTLPAERIQELEPTAVPGCWYCAERHTTREQARSWGAVRLVRACSADIAAHPHGAAESLSGGHTAPQEG